MHDYSRLPTLVLNKIFDHLSVKERIKCKAVCRFWKEEIELREKSDALVLHIGPYLWNIRWSLTNNRGLMKFENSFQVKHLAFLKRPLIRSLLANIKKLAIVKFHSNFAVEASDLSKYTGCFDQCEEIEIMNFQLTGILAFDLPKLKVLVIKESPLEQLTLNCPSLEVLFWNSVLKVIFFYNTKKLKRLTCFGWRHQVLLGGCKLTSIEYLNMFLANDVSVYGHLFDLMPNLKQLVLYSSHPHADLESIRRQQKCYGLSELEIVFCGFSDPVGIAFSEEFNGFVRIDSNVGELFDNYSKLVESSPWRVCLDYSKLFSQFKILPSSFFERFSEPFVIEISAVTNYTHLFEFLRCYPTVQQLKIHFSKVKAYRILDLVRWLQPSLSELTIVEEHPSDVRKIDLSFMRLFDLVQLRLVCTRFPAEFIRRVAAKRASSFCMLEYQKYQTISQPMVIYFSSKGLVLVDFNDQRRNSKFSTIEQLISGMQSDWYFGKFLLT